MHKTTVASDAILRLIHHQHKVIVKAMNIVKLQSLNKVQLDEHFVKFESSNKIQLYQARTTPHVLLCLLACTYSLSI